MCCFTGKVEHVANTSIFARLRPEGDEQHLVYQMSYETRSDVAMILPIPTVLDCPETAVRFIDLSEYDNLFRDMKKGFPEPAQAYMRTRGMMMIGAAAGSAPLEVHRVGSFEASFVPKRKDFFRLDERFRLPLSIWRQFPGEYRDYGFIVCKLKSYSSKIHPLGLTFPTRFSDKIVFPTVHVHDGEVHTRARFDHDLYYQPSNDADYSAFPHFGWTESTSHAKKFVLTNKTKGLVLPGLPCWKLEMKGTYDNRDVVLTKEAKVGSAT